jgi:hypothetical protein
MRKIPPGCRRQHQKNRERGNKYFQVFVRPQFQQLIDGVSREHNKKEDPGELVLPIETVAVEIRLYAIILFSYMSVYSSVTHLLSSNVRAFHMTV